MSVLTLYVDEVMRTLSSDGQYPFVEKDKTVDIVRFALNTGFTDVALDEYSALRVMYQRPGETEVRAQTLTYYDTDGLHNHYDWHLLPSDLAKKGTLTVALCILRTNGGVEEWHTTPCQVRVLGSIHADDSDEADETITPTVAQRVAVLETMIQRVASGAPIVVSSMSAMTDTEQIYVLSTDGMWYYYDDSVWVAGGEYGAVATDTTLTQSGKPADAKAVGDKLTGLKSDLNNTSQVVYKAEISSLVGLIPFHAKNGDSITMKTKDGSNFVHNDQLRFYDVSGAMIKYWSAAPTTVNSRTFVYDNETEALYIGLTKVASSVTDYVVVNTSSPYLTDITDREAALQNQINAVDNRSTVKNLSELFVYEQPSISVSSGLLPFPVKTNDSITIERIDGQLFQNTVQIRFYGENKNYIGYIGTIPYDKATRTVTFSYADAYYVGVTDVGSVAGTYRVINNNSKSLLFAEINERKAFDTLISNRVDILDSQAAKAKVINRFNKATITAGKYINPNTGNLNSSDGFFASDFIYIGDLASVTVSYTHIFCWYDENKEWKGHPDNMNSASADLTYSIPEDVVYLRFSAYNANLNSAQVGESVTRNNYAPFGVYNLPELRVSQSQIDTSSGSQIVVDASGGGDYTSFTQAIYDTVDDGTDVFIKPGTYDMVAEYVALFGQSAVDSMADADSAIFNGFQYGVRLRNRRVEFASGAHLVCDWTGHLVDGTHRFSALGVDYNVEIVGLDLDVTATFYCIHDDYGIATPYTVKYENCRVVGHNLTNANCIGGGCKKYSRHILSNCYFDNNLTGSATVRYHNTNAEGSEPEIYVSNCYFNNWFTPRWYGAQTSKMRVYVNNCRARAIYKMQESSSFNVDNVELYKWNNEETNPVTE